MPQAVLESLASRSDTSLLSTDLVSQFPNSIQIARSIPGVVLVGSASTEEGRVLIKKEGAQFALDHSAPGYMKELDTISAGKGVDLTIEMLANVNLGALAPPLLTFIFSLFPFVDLFQIMTSRPPPSVAASLSSGAAAT